MSNSVLLGLLLSADLSQSLAGGAPSSFEIEERHTLQVIIGPLLALPWPPQCGAEFEITRCIVLVNRDSCISLHPL